MVGGAGTGLEAGDDLAVPGSERGVAQQSVEETVGCGVGLQDGKGHLRGGRACPGMASESFVEIPGNEAETAVFAAEEQVVVVSGAQHGVVVGEPGIDGHEAQD